MNDLVQENQRSRQMAEEAERSVAIRSELQRLGVAKVDLAYRAVKDDIQRGEDGRLTAKGGQGDVPVREYLAQFVQENPELLPARITGGSGMGVGSQDSCDRRRNRSGQDSTGHECGRSGESPPGDCASGEPGNARSLTGAGEAVRKMSDSGRISERNKKRKKRCHQLHQQMSQVRL